MARTRPAFVIFAVCLLCMGATLFANTVVPNGSAPQIDGTLAAGEWDDALSIPLSDAASLFLKHAGGYLYLGIQATSMGVGSPLIVRGGEILVLHASAALGTAIYVRKDDAWTLRQDFEWKCRSTGFSAPAKNERARFLQQNGWLGTIGYLGDPNQFEYEIAWEDESLTLLFLFADFTDTIHLLSWPIPPADAAPYETVITASPTPPQMQFDTESWAILQKGE